MRIKETPAKTLTKSIRGSDREEILEQAKLLEFCSMTHVMPDSFVNSRIFGDGEEKEEPIEDDEQEAESDTKHQKIIYSLAKQIGLEKDDTKIIMAPDDQIYNRVRAETLRLYTNEPNNLSAFTFTAVQLPREILRALYMGIIDGKNIDQQAKDHAKRALKIAIEGITNQTSPTESNRTIPQLMRGIRANVMVNMLKFTNGDGAKDIEYYGKNWGIIDGVLPLSGKNFDIKFITSALKKQQFFNEQIT